MRTRWSEIIQAWHYCDWKRFGGEDEGPKIHDALCDLTAVSFSFREEAVRSGAGHLPESLQLVRQPPQRDQETG